MSYYIMLYKHAKRVRNCGEGVMYLLLMIF